MHDAGPDHRTKTVLVVDDVPDNIRIASHILRDRYRVIFATDGERALALAAADEPPSLILLD